MGKLTLRQYSEDDKYDIVKLLQEGHAKDYTLERWDWLHHNSATLGSHIVVAEYDGRVVGASGVIKKRFTYNHQRLTGGKAVDPIVDKSMRGKGVFTKFLSFLDEMCSDVFFVYAFPNPMSLRGFLKKGYASVGPIPTPYCQLRFQDISTKEKLRYMTTGMKVLLRKQTNVVQGTFEDLRDLTPLTPKDRYALLRDWNYIKWRYQDSPVKSYDVLISRQNGAILNACILYRRDWQVSIVDVVEYKGDVNLADYLTAIKKIYGRSRILAWDSNLESISKFFKGSRKTGQNFVVREKDSEAAATFLNKSHWYVTRGDVESN